MWLPPEALTPSPGPNPSPSASPSPNPTPNPVQALLANDELEQPGDQEELTLQFNPVATQPEGKQYPCLPDGTETPQVTELAMGPEEPRLFSLNGSRFLL